MSRKPNSEVFIEKGSGLSHGLLDRSINLRIRDVTTSGPAVGHVIELHNFGLGSKDLKRSKFYPSN